MLYCPSSRCSLLDDLLLLLLLYYLLWWRLLLFALCLLGRLPRHAKTQSAVRRRRPAAASEAIWCTTTISSSLGICHFLLALVYHHRQQAVARSSTSQPWWSVVEGLNHAEERRTASLGNRFIRNHDESRRAAERRCGGTQHDSTRGAAPTNGSFSVGRGTWVFERRNSMKHPFSCTQNKKGPLFLLRQSHLDLALQSHPVSERGSLSRHTHHPAEPSSLWVERKKAFLEPLSECRYTNGLFPALFHPRTSFSYYFTVVGAWWGKRCELFLPGSLKNFLVTPCG